MYEIIKKFLDEGGRCLLIENGKPVGVVLTMEEYEDLRNKPEITNQKPEIIEPKINTEKNLETNTNNPIGAAMVEEMDFPEASAEFADIGIEEDVTLEDLGLDELPY